MNEPIRLMACFLVVLALLPTGKNASADDEGGLTELPAVVTVDLIDGTASRDAVFQVIAEDIHWIANEVATVMKSVGVLDYSVRLSSSEVQGLVQRFPDVFSFVVDQPAQPAAVSSSDVTDSPGLAPTGLRIDRGALAKNLSNKKSALRLWLAAAEDKRLSELKKVDATWRGKPDSPSRVVITMAGLHAFASTADEMAVAIHQQTRLPMLTFAYPNDEPIRQSAGRLVDHLARFHALYPETKITIVTHSMGGLVARGALELPELQPAHHSAASSPAFGVDQLVQVCPPNHGSALAEYGPLLEGVEQLAKLFDKDRDRRSRILLGMIVDGFNEAPADLATDSEYLNDLNFQPRNADVRYSILAGNDGPLRAGTTFLLGEVWGLVSANIDEPENLNRRISELVRCDDLVQGRGDGVVAISSAKLEGVPDFEILPMHHLSWAQLDTDGGKQIVDAVSKRLGVSL